jgi:hypothetical protein
LRELWFPIYFLMQIGREAGLLPRSGFSRAAAAAPFRPSLAGDPPRHCGRVAATGGAWRGQGGRHAKRGSRLGPAMLLPRGNLPCHRGACVGWGCRGAEGVGGRRMRGGGGGGVQRLTTSHLSACRTHTSGARILSTTFSKVQSNAGKWLFN